MAMGVMNVPYIAAANCGPFAKRIGLARPSIALYGGFAVADGNILIAVQNDREWVAFADKVLQQPELGRDPRFATNNSRVINRTEREALIRAIVSTMTKAKALQKLDEARIAWGQISALKGLLTHDGATRTTCSREGDSIELIAGPAVVDRRRNGSGETPAFGQNDAALRAEFT